MQGVGGRQAKPPPQAGGGGYLETCAGMVGAREADSLALMQELCSSHLGAPWLHLAEAIGPRRFLVVWDALCCMLPRHDSARRMLYIPAMDEFLRNQRDQVIQALTESGVPPPEIARQVRSVFGRSVSDRTILRTIQRLRSNRS